MPARTSRRTRQSASPRTELRLDDGWRFHLGDAPNAHEKAYDDSAWRTVDLPHDWSIEDLPPLASGDTLLIDAVEGQWRFHKGDDPAWSAPTLDDSSWQVVTLPGTWEEHSGYTDDNVHGWYRRTLTIDPRDRGRRLRLGVGQVDDVDETFFNGVRIGGCGTFPPNYQSAYSDLRVYDVPPELVRYDKPNIVAVRVFDGPGSGGIYQKTPIATRNGPFDSTAPSGSSTGYTIGGTGWYRTSFERPSMADGERVMVRFDGVYMNADIWLNGTHVCTHPYGYTSFWVELTPHLVEGTNVLAVQVKNTGVNARWYSGSGIYRHVWLTTFGAVHIAPWGVSITTPRASRARAFVSVRTTVHNQDSKQRSFRVRTTVLDGDGTVVSCATIGGRANAGERTDVDQQFELTRPRLWDIDSPVMYSARSEVLVDGAATDSVETPFGIRSITIDAQKGMRLNGKPIKLKGACMHHDNGPLGACAFDRAEERRVEIMKANGYNAIRTSHNPPSAAFLDACDRLGMLVMDEAFDVWYQRKRLDDYSRSFGLSWVDDLDSMLLRDRNHPCIFMWSVGNEVGEQSMRLGVDVARMLTAHVHEIEPTRPVTVAQCYGHIWQSLDPMFAELDAGGYNYQIDKYESDHRRVASRVMIATETFPSRAYDYWQEVLKRPYLIGDFVWTGYDYLGEAGIGWGTGWGNLTYPWTVAFCGDIDLCGYKKPQSYFRDMLWHEDPRVHIVVKCPSFTYNSKPSSGAWEWEDVAESWNWDGHEGTPMEVKVYSNCDRVRLELDGTSVGTQPVKQCAATFTVPYRPGRLSAVGIRARREVASGELATAGTPTRIALTADRTTMAADGQDLCFVTVDVVDSAGRPAVNWKHPVEFALEGPAVLAGVGTGNPVSTESFQLPTRTPWHGRCQAIVRTTRATGPVTLRAWSKGVPATTLELSVRPA